jgi:hypothetical protein
LASDFFRFSRQVQMLFARVVKLVDAGDSKSPAARRAGSIPAPGTISEKPFLLRAETAFLRLARARSMTAAAHRNNCSAWRLTHRFLIGNISQGFSRESDGVIEGGCVVQGVNVREALADEHAVCNQLFEKNVPASNQKSICRVLREIA